MGEYGAEIRERLENLYEGDATTRREQLKYYCLHPIRLLKDLRVKKNFETTVFDIIEEDSCSAVIQARSRGIGEKEWRRTKNTFRVRKESSLKHIFG
jgi:hypothetical protein